MIVIEVSPDRGKGCTFGLNKKGEKG